MKFTKAILLAGAVPAFVSAGEPPSKGAAIEMPAPAKRWTFGASFAPLLNVDAEFSGLGDYASAAAPAPLGGGRDYEYENGYVRVDSSGNQGGRTTNWGYQDASQYDAGSNTLSFNLTSSTANGRVGASEDFSPGFEFFGYLDMGNIAEIANRPVSWGFKAGLHYANISINSSRSLTSDVLQITDAFDTSGITMMPPAGYEGTAEGPGSLLGDSPTRSATIISGGAFVAGDRELDVDMVTLSAGPYIKLPVSDKFSVFAEAGVSLSIARGRYDFDSTTTIIPLGTQVSSDDETRTVLLPGLFAGVSAIWQLTDSFGIHGSARYQYIDQFSVDAGGSNAELSFDGSAIISLGGVWSF